MKEILKKLLLYRYRYNITMPFNTFNNIRVKAFNVKIDNENVNFDTHRNCKRLHNFDGLDIIDRYRDLLIYLFKKRLMAFTAILIILIIFLVSNFTIRDIKFKEDIEYNYSVYQDVNKHIKRLGPFKILDNSLNDISNELKQKYYNYAYIGLERRGSKILIDIEYVEHEVPEENKDFSYSNIVSNVDGKIVGIETKTGLTLVSINQIVSKGDLLVTGNLNYYTNPYDYSNLVKSDAQIFIQYAKYVEVEVPKKIYIEKYNNNFKKYYKINIFGYELTGNNYFDNSYIKSENIFKIGNIFNLTKVYEYEKIDCQYLFNKNDAMEFSINKIYTDFESKKVNKIEKIEFIKVIKEEEFEEFYKFSYLIKCVESNVIQEEIKKEN